MKRSVACCSLLILLLFNTTDSRARQENDTLFISTDTSYNLTPYIHYFVETDRQFGIEDLSTGTADDLFQHLKKGKSTDVSLDMNIWIRLRIKNCSGSDLEYFFSYSSFGNPDSVLFYDLEKTGAWKASYRGLRVEPYQKDYPTTKFKFSPDETKTLFVRMVFKNFYYPSLHLYLSMKPSTQLLTELGKNNSFFGLFYGAMTAVILFCLMFAYFLSDKNYYLLTALFFTTTIYFLHLNGIGARLFWNHYPFSLLDTYGDTVFLILNNVLITLFAAVFMRTRENARVLHYIIWFSCIGTCLCVSITEIPFIIRNFTSATFAISDFADYLQLGWIASLLFTAIFLAFKKSVPAKLFLLCSSVPLLEELAGFFGFIDYGNNGIFIGHSSQIAFGASGILFSIVIGFNSYQMRKSQREAESLKYKAIQEKETLIRQQNIMLEKQVEIRTHELAAEKSKSDELLLNILPAEVAEELKSKGNADARLFDEVTVMFTDFKDFTQISEELSPTELVKQIDICFKAFDKIISAHHLEKIKTIGDSYMCAGGLPVPNQTNAADIVGAAIEICEFMEQEKQRRKAERKPFFEIRIGCHTGPVVAGIVGIKKFAYDIWGDTVNIASRMESSGEAGKVNISGATYELVKDQFSCEYRGKISAKNKGENDMYFANRRLAGD